MSKRFLFFENFKSIADKLPDDMRLKFYDALLSYVFDGVEPDDVMIAALTIFALLCLASFTQQRFQGPSTHVIARIRISFPSKTGATPLLVYTTFGLSIHC